MIKASFGAAKSTTIKKRKAVKQMKPNIPPVALTKYPTKINMYSIS